MEGDRCMEAHTFKGWIRPMKRYLRILIENKMRPDYRFRDAGAINIVWIDFFFLENFAELRLHFQNILFDVT